MRLLAPSGLVFSRNSIAKTCQVLKDGNVSSLCDIVTYFCVSFGYYGIKSNDYFLCSSRGDAYHETECWKYRPDCSHCAWVGHHRLRFLFQQLVRCHRDYPALYRRCKLVPGLYAVWFINLLNKKLTVNKGNTSAGKNLKGFSLEN